ncbi:hypothetical protein J6590_070449 [Homalodisca vitripennis]|nr:hypothetical protein J6590_070449 [Homalodisca vitripennis]
MNDSKSSRSQNLIDLFTPQFSLVLFFSLDDAPSRSSTPEYDTVLFHSPTDTSSTPDSTTKDPDDQGQRRFDHYVPDKEEILSSERLTESTRNNSRNPDYFQNEDFDREQSIQESGDKGGSRRTSVVARDGRQVDYVYYYLGPRLWYIPLFFSIYFVIYILALIIKAISRHKILFPQAVQQTAAARSLSDLDQLTLIVSRQLADAAVKYLRRRIIDPSKLSYFQQVAVFFSSDNNNNKEVGEV